MGELVFLLAFIGFFFLEQNTQQCILFLIFLFLVLYFANNYGKGD